MGDPLSQSRLDDRSRWNDSRQALEAVGWKYNAVRSGYASRDLYQRGSFEILCECSASPWITLRKRLGNRIDWFVDFPSQVSIEAVLGFVVLTEAE